MKPILFSTSMVQAILDGKKTQTRRVIKPQPPEDESFEGPYWFEPSIEGKDGELEPGTPIYGLSAMDGLWGIKCPYQPGDILWVRETWCPMEKHFGVGTEPKYCYKAEQTPESEQCRKDFGIPWKPSIHMPREAARIFLRVTNVRVERLQEITEEDARAEGVNGIPRSTVLYPNDDYIYPFKQLWNSLNQKRSYGWDTNPWVWIYEFEKISKEEAERQG